MFKGGEYLCMELLFPVYFRGIYGKDGVCDLLCGNSAFLSGNQSGHAGREPWSEVCTGKASV